MSWEFVQHASNNENVATLLFSVHWPTNNILLVPLCSSLEYGTVYIIMFYIFLNNKNGKSNFKPCEVCYNRRAAI